MAENTQDLREEVAQLRADVASLTDTLRGMARESGDAVRDRARDGVERLESQSREQAERAGQAIEERPFTSVVSAFGIGIILGILMDRRR